MLTQNAVVSGYSARPRQVITLRARSSVRPRRWLSGLGFLRVSNKIDIQTSSTVQPSTTTSSAAASPTEGPIVYRSIASLSSVASLSSLDEFDDETANFRFIPSQLEVFRDLANNMQNCSRGLAALAFGSVVMNAFEAVEHAHHHHHSEHVQSAEELAGQAAGAAGAAVSSVTGQAAAVADKVAVALPGVLEQANHLTTGGMGFLQEALRAVSLTDVAFCINEVIPALLIMYAAAPFEQLARNPDEPHMALALKGVGRLSVTLQQLAWTSGSVAVVLLLTAAAEYPPIVGVASWSCMALAVARGASLWWVISQHTTSGEEVARTLAALRGGVEGRDMNPLDRAASWLALGVLLQAEERLHANHLRHHTHSNPVSHQHQHQHQQDRPLDKTHEARDLVDVAGMTSNGSGVASAAAGAGATAAAALSPFKPHYTFDSEEERVLLSLVEATNAAGLAISLLALATLALGLAEAGGASSNTWVSSIILAAQKAANATVLFASAAAFDRALHNDDGNDDTDHLLDGLGREHSGMTGLFTSMAVLSLALILAGSVALLIPSLEDSPLGVLVGDGVMHASADLLIGVLEGL
ncbi:hypothetical protein Vretimale_11714 [Volvox reticuliferus]|uniref:Uncharacterized protein n=1 Tax=Volvox reticuliferus TaxID=1737510 RepID=A0A8J4D667_9CHLO|nr:hypothetical protein Vretifemale_20266 [Volvox reticuliferus]GIM07640.1 hypothetical protein Vretimale_11714 [Volvox reticuliferus]